MGELIRPWSPVQVFIKIYVGDNYDVIMELDSMKGSKTIVDLTMSDISQKLEAEKLYTLGRLTNIFESKEIEESYLLILRSLKREVLDSEDDDNSGANLDLIASILNLDPTTIGEDEESIQIDYQLNVEKASDVPGNLGLILSNLTSLLGYFNFRVYDDSLSLN